ncbi:PRC and DUF2382 domain-containing protein [Actinomadura mexicana]|uniref:Conserved domain-containing protein n=1 Tax=Actinomadura mexicana TaxID=134959 RepID=A0A239CNF3_9ACTN|nr:PRC and DUF2382 domain-containing protein [Actinomadura mexicana]SNS21660.1 conserved domain-containing protein [Actinomadura mexicana]
MQTQTQVRELMGMSVTDTNGTKVGTVKQVYLNDDSGSPEWVTVHTGWFGMRESFVPLSGARKAEDALQVPYDKETIKGAPNVDADEHLSHAQIVDLYRHYGVRPPGGRRTGGETDSETGTSETAESAGAAGTAAATGTAETSETAGTRGAAETRSSAGTAATTGTAGTAGTAGAAGMAVHPERGKRGTAGERGAGRTMPPQSAREGAETPMTEITRSEEQMRIGTERHEAGRVRVRKWIETETVEQTIPVSHEEIRIDREPIAGGRPDPKATIAEADQEIILYEERPVISKETVPVERVRLRTEQVQDEQTVRGELRKERIEVTRDDGARGPRREERGEGGGPSA